MTTVDATTKALEDAAFHAWLTLGDMLTNHVPKAEIKNAYIVLETALSDFRTAHGELCADPGAAAEGTMNSPH